MKFLKKCFWLIVPSKNGFRMIWSLLPAILFGWVFLPTGVITYTSFITVCILVLIWLDIMDIRDKLGIK